MDIRINYPKAKCAYCGKQYTKQHNRQTYCSDECRENARKEKKRIYNSKYYYKNKKRLHQTQIGTRSIGPRANPNKERESEIIQNEIERIGLKTLL